MSIVTTPIPQGSEGVTTFWFGDLPIRAKNVDGDPWLFLADICTAIGTRVVDAASGLDEDEKRYDTVNQPGNSDIAAHMVSEPGFYSLIMRSRKPVAKAFKRFVTHEVLPSIRKTGGYGTQKELSRRELAQMVIDAEDRAETFQLERDKAWGDIERNAPKVNYVDRFVKPTDTACTVRVLAKELNVSERKLFDYLKAKRRIYKDPNGMYQPYANWVPWFSLKDQPEVKRLHNGQMRTTLYVTPVGKEGIRRMLERTPID